jgi:hypothetical protein
MKPAKNFVIETAADGSTTTRTNYKNPLATEYRDAKARIMELANSGQPLTICVVEHVNSRTYSTDGHGKIRIS